MLPTDVVKCAACQRTVPNHKWAKVRADGWFFQKDGTAYCPDDVPEWVEGWRRNSGTTPIAAQHSTVLNPDAVGDPARTPLLQVPAAAVDGWWGLVQANRWAYGVPEQDAAERGPVALHPAGGVPRDPAATKVAPAANRCPAIASPARAEHHRDGGTDD